MGTQRKSHRHQQNYTTACLSFWSILTKMPSILGLTTTKGDTARDVHSKTSNEHATVVDDERGHKLCGQEGMNGQEEGWGASTTTKTSGSEVHFHVGKVGISSRSHRRLTHNLHLTIPPQKMHLIVGAVSLWTRPPALYLSTGPSKSPPHLMSCPQRVSQPVQPWEHDCLLHDGTCGTRTTCPSGTSITKFKATGESLQPTRAGARGSASSTLMMSCDCGTSRREKLSGPRNLSLQKRAANNLVQELHGNARILQCLNQAGQNGP